MSATGGWEFAPAIVEAYWLCAACGRFAYGPRPLESDAYCSECDPWVLVEGSATDVGCQAEEASHELPVP